MIHQVRNEEVLVDPPEGFDWDSLEYFAIGDDTYRKLLDEIKLSHPAGRGQAKRSIKAFLKQLERMRYFKELNPEYVLSGKRPGEWSKVFQHVTKFKLAHREALSTNDPILHTRMALMQLVEPCIFDNITTTTNRVALSHADAGSDDSAVGRSGADSGGGGIQVRHTTIQESNELDRRMNIVNSYRQKTGTHEEWLTDNQGVPHTTILRWVREAKENGMWQELVEADTLSQNINHSIAPNVNEDKQETIRIMTDKSLQNVYNLCTIIDVDLPNGRKQQILVMKSDSISSLVEEKMSQGNSDYTPLLEDCLNEPCTRRDCKCCIQMELQANLARDKYFLDLKNQADFEDHDFDDDDVLWDIRESQEFQKKKKIYDYLRPIHPFYMDPDALTQTLYLGSSTKEGGCAYEVGPHGIQGKYDKDGADDMVKMFEATKKQMNANTPHPFLCWRNDNLPTQLEDVNASMIERVNEEDDYGIDIQDSDGKATSNTTDTTINLTNDSVDQSMISVPTRHSLRLNRSTDQPSCDPWINPYEIGNKNIEEDTCLRAEYLPADQSEGDSVGGESKGDSDDELDVEDIEGEMHDIMFLGERETEDEDTDIDNVYDVQIQNPDQVQLQFYPNDHAKYRSRRCVNLTGFSQRLFESTQDELAVLNYHMTHAVNLLLQWVFPRVKQVMGYDENEDDDNCIKQQWFVKKYIIMSPVLNRITKTLPWAYLNPLEILAKSRMNKSMLDVVFVIKQALFYRSIDNRFVKKYVLGKERKPIWVIPIDFVTYSHCTGGAIATVKTAKQLVGPGSAGLTILKSNIYYGDVFNGNLYSSAIVHKFGDAKNGGNEMKDDAVREVISVLLNGRERMDLLLNHPLPSFRKLQRNRKHYGTSRIIRSTVEPFQAPYGTMDHVSQHQFNGDNNLDNAQKSENSTRYYSAENGFPYLVNPNQVECCLDEDEVLQKGDKCACM